jgi:hypothetical protein
MSYFAQTKVTDAWSDLVQIAPGGELSIVEPVRLAGGTFSGSTLDPNFATATVVGTGSVVQANGQITLRTGATANSSAVAQTIGVARFVGESANRYTGVVQLGDTGAANNIRRWGAFNGTDGFYFMLNGTTLYTATMRAGVETAVPFASWNQTIAAPTLTNSNVYRIIYTTQRAFFMINNIPANLMTFPTATPTATYHLPVYGGNVNSGGGTADVTISARVTTIQRLGKFETQPVFGRITTAATQVLKYGPGTLHKIVLNNASGTLITVYDNTAGSGTTIAIIDTPSQANPVTLFYDTAFNNGLTIVSTGTWDATVVYQ